MAYLNQPEGNFQLPKIRRKQSVGHIPSWASIWIIYKAKVMAYLNQPEGNFQLPKIRRKQSVGYIHHWHRHWNQFIS